MTSTIHSITFDCHEPTELARFWAAATGFHRGEADELDEVAVLHDPVGRYPRLLFIKVPEEKSVKNRVHLDLQAEGDMATEVQRLVGLGAHEVRVVDESPDDLFTVMQDTEGNEFCVEAALTENGESRP